MNKRRIKLRFYTISGMFLFLCTCSANRDKPNTATVQHKDTVSVDCFWNMYDFADTVRWTNKSVTTERMLVDYLSRLSGLTENKACESLRKLVLRTKVNEMVSHWFLKQLERHLYEPDSPLRNDNYYISVLEETLVSGHLNGMMRVRPLYQLKMLKKNRAGTKAADFDFILPTGKHQNLWDIPAKYTILLFYDPDCIHCWELMRELSEASIINSCLQHNGLALPQLALITICTEGDMETWKEYQHSLPSPWVNGYDARNILLEKELYSLRSLPSIYLLGENKQVLLKEPSSISEVINYLLNEYDITK
ncbi:DUF5106 domain-containing protein [Bacteroides faecium]|uniref:DUF5106 domain-containing protein n=2 Tax=Bacteroides faecium TaxID=2715212 RepID=A0A6H0KTS2_9BACE|nr:DUF5106 domain-containing protein [Bacteroides faecium]